MTALDFLLALKTEFACAPWSRERNAPASNSDLRRWLDQSAVEINGAKPKSQDEISLPITSLVFFPKSKNRTTV